MAGCCNRCSVPGLKLLKPDLSFFSSSSSAARPHSDSSGITRPPQVFSKDHNLKFWIMEITHMDFLKHFHKQKPEECLTGDLKHNVHSSTTMPTGLENLCLYTDMTEALCLESLAFIMTRIG